MVCRALSERLGLHFLTVSRESRATIRAVFEPRDGVRVYEMHGDLMFAGVEKVLRTVCRDSEEFDVAVLDVTRVDTINDAARALLAGMSAILEAAGKHGLLVDPDAAVAEPGRGYDDVVFGSLEDALEAATALVRNDFG